MPNLLNMMETISGNLMPTTTTKDSEDHLIGPMRGKKKKKLKGSSDTLKPTGEPTTGFVRGEDGRGKSKGPNNCGNCIHQHKGLCSHPVMVKSDKVCKRKNGLPIVDSDDCCSYVRRPKDNLEQKAQ